jgi:hypothetical protein
MGDRVWIASNSIVLKGSVLPDDTIVAAGSTVVGEVTEPGQIVGGSPARVLMSGVRWLMEPPPCVWKAEGAGFEPARPCGLPVFKTGAINRALPPLRGARWAARSEHPRSPGV